MTEIEKVKRAAELLDSKKAYDIVALDLCGSTIIAEYFVICTAGSTPQMNALYDAVCEGMAKDGCPPLHVEGIKNAGWIVVDFDGVMVHIFSRQMRDFYGLDNLWADAKKIDLGLNPEKGNDSDEL